VENRDQRGVWKYNGIQKTEPMSDPEEDIPEVVIHPMGDSIDLHTFQPKEAASIVQEYLRECRERGLTEVRIIHGKGTGVLREIVHRELLRSPPVASFRLAAPESGGWGATWVVLHGNP
jgi:DNA-nicking Smr family endonuclease